MQRHKYDRSPQDPVVYSTGMAAVWEEVTTCRFFASEQAKAGQILLSALLSLSTILL